MNIGDNMLLDDEMVLEPQPQKFGVIIADPPWSFNDTLK